MPRSPEQLEEHRKQKKKLIMDVALELFAKGGFHATSISQVTRKAGISKGLIYNYFSSKQDMLEEITETAYNEVYKNFDLDKDGVLTNEEFIFFIKETFRIVRENMSFWQLYFALMVQPGIQESFSEKYQEKSKPILNQIYTFLQKNGSTDPEGDLFILSSLVEGAILYLVVAPDIFPSGKMEDKILQACFRLISTPEAPPKN